MDNYIIYKYTSPSGKVYIGQTNSTIETRAGSNGIRYLRKKPNGEYSQPYIANAILKYGFDNFKKEILYSGLTREEANKKEIETIALYNSTDRRYGYNIKSGGGNFSEEDKLNQSESMKKAWANPNSKYHTMIRPKPSKKTIQKMRDGKIESYKNMTEKDRIEYSRNRTIAPVNQYDLDGNFIKQWLSMRELELEGFNRVNINSVCRRRLTSKGYVISTYKGYQWRYANDCDDITSYRRPSRYSNCKQFKRVALINDNGDILKEYDSVISAASDLDISASGVSNVCRGRYKTTKGYIFKYIA